MTSDRQEPAEKSPAFTRLQWLIAAIVVLSLLRAMASAFLPVSADEAYYWLWSKHLSAGYLDHPPAIAFLIRLGTVMFGATPFGLRLSSLVLSLIATGLVWRTAVLLLGREEMGALAAVYFNLTLMVAAETLAATPDAPAVACAAGFLCALVRLDVSGDPRWWLAVGAAGGLALLSKYTALFLGLGAAVWLVATEEGRRWLRTPWPYAGGVAAALIFLPNLIWNFQHHFQTFAFQFARVGSGEFTLRFLAEFLGAQIGMASPFILLLACVGLVRSSRERRLRLVVILVAPSIAYFFIHALHDRVQANWPSFLFPALAVAAAAASNGHGKTDAFARVSVRLAMPVAGVMLAACYAQALFGVIPMGRSDPLSRLLGFGMRDVAEMADQIRVRNGAVAIVTTDYATTGWLIFYRSPSASVFALDEEHRWTMAPIAVVASQKTFLYVAEDRHDRHELLATQFGKITFAGKIARNRASIPIAHYVAYRLAEPRSSAATAFSAP